MSTEIATATPTCSPEIGELVAALSAAQSEFPTVAKDNTAKVETSKGPGYSYKYADLASCLSAIRGPLGRHGLAVIQVPVQGPTDLLLRTIVAHKSGQWISGDFPLICGDWNRPQTVGSVITYVRRYILCSMLQIATDDDDGAAAQTSARTQRPAAYSPQPRRDVPSQAAKPADAAPPPAPSAAVAEITEFFDKAAAPSEGKRWKDKVKELEAEGKPTTIPQTEVTAADGSHLARGERRTWAGDLFALCRATNAEWESMCKAHGEKFRSIASQGVLERFLIDWAIGQGKIAPDYLLTQGREDRSKQTAFLERWHAKYRDEFIELAQQSLADLLNEAIESHGIHLDGTIETEPAEVEA